MDWDDLRVFLAVARAESLSAAGRRLAMDPATVGRRIARLEEGAKTRLFLKSPQGYALTEEGAGLVPAAEAAESAAEAARDALGQAQGQAGISGQIRLGAPDGCANYVLPKVIAAICAQNPALEVQIVSLPRVLNLSKREADIAIGVSRPLAGRLRVQKLADYHLHLAAHPDYLRQAAPLTGAASLRGHRMVGYIPDMIFDKELDYLSALTPGHLQMASNSVSVQLNLLQAGAGIGVIHDFARPFAPDLVQVLPELRFARAFWLIRHEADVHSARLNRFADLLALGVKREIYRLEQMVPSAQGA